MYYDDHNPPHFHAEYSGQKAIFDIRTGKKIKGTFSKRGQKLVEEWAKLRRAELEKDWELCAQRKPLAKIKPLN